MLEQFCMIHSLKYKNTVFNVIANITYTSLKRSDLYLSLSVSVCVCVSSRLFILLKKNDPLLLVSKRSHMFNSMWARWKDTDLFSATTHTDFVCDTDVKINTCLVISRGGSCCNGAVRRRTSFKFTKWVRKWPLCPAVGGKFCPTLGNQDEQTFQAKLVVQEEAAASGHKSSPAQRWREKADLVCLFFGGEFL